MPVHTKRALVIGDSISSLVYDDSSAPNANNLWVTQLSLATGINIQSLSAPGNRITVGGAADASIRFNANAFNLMRGVELPKFVIITAGTNDYGGGDTWFTTNVSGWSFIDDYQWVVQYWKNNGVPALCVEPLWRADEANPIGHPDGVRICQDYRDKVVQIAELKGMPYMQHTSFDLVPSDFVSDGLHMNASGHSKFFAAMFSRLQQLNWI